MERRPGVIRFGAPMLLEQSAEVSAASEEGKESVELLRFVTPYKTLGRRVMWRFMMYT